MNLNRSASLTIVILTIVMVSHNPDLARTASSSLSPYVAGVERILRKSGLKHELTAMGSIIEGNLDEILPVLREMHEQPFGQGAVRVSTLIKIDDRRDKPGSIEGKIRSVKEKLGE